MSPANPLPASSPAARIFDEIRKAIPRLSLVYQRTAAPEVQGTTAISRHLLEALKKLAPRELLGAGGEATGAKTEKGQAVLAGLLLRADCLEESHAVSQGLSTTEGSYWHGILHRREPDFDNARYWFRRVGEHPVFLSLAYRPSTPSRTTAGLDEVLRDGRWDPFRFIDLCEACEGGSRPELRAELEALQDREVELLLKFCAQGALGKEDEEDWRRERNG